MLTKCVFYVDDVLITNPISHSLARSLVHLFTRSLAHSQSRLSLSSNRSVTDRVVTFQRKCATEPTHNACVSLCEFVWERIKEGML